MATLTSLPEELLRLVLKHLNPFELEIVAQTFNRRLYHAAYPMLAPYLLWLSRVKRIRDVFVPEGDRRIGESVDERPLPSYFGHFPTLNFALGARMLRLPPELAEKLGLDGGFETFYTKSSPPDLRSWMKLDGSFEWLKPLPGSLQQEMSAYHGASKEAVTTHEYLNALGRQAKELGLTLPPEFGTFVCSDELHYRLPSSMAWYFELGQLSKCTAGVDRGNGGYVLRFHNDQQACAFSYLYLNKHGDNCVLWSINTLREASESDDEVHDPPEAAKDLTLESQEEGSGSQQEEDPLAEQFIKDTLSEDEDTDHTASDDDSEGIELQSLSFEEYLATTYYEEMLWFLVHRPTFDPPQGLKDYAKHVYLPVPLENREVLQGDSQGTNSNLLLTPFSCSPERCTD